MKKDFPAEVVFVSGYRQPVKGFSYILPVEDGPIKVGLGISHPDSVDFWLYSDQIREIETEIEIITFNPEPGVAFTKRLKRMYQR